MRRGHAGNLRLLSRRRRLQEGPPDTPPGSHRLGRTTSTANALAAATRFQARGPADHPPASPGPGPDRRKRAGPVPGGRGLPWRRRGGDGGPPRGGARPRGGRREGAGAALPVDLVREGSALGSRHGPRASRRRRAQYPPPPPGSGRPAGRGRGRRRGPSGCPGPLRAAPAGRRGAGSPSRLRSPWGCGGETEALSRAGEERRRTPGWGPFCLLINHRSNHRGSISRVCGAWPWSLQAQKQLWSNHCTDE